jgi:uncharacterized protein YqeY
MISTTIDQEIKKAMLAKNSAQLRGLRAIKAALLLAKTEKGSSEEITEETELKILQKLIKQRRESADIYKAQNRPDLLEKEEAELAVIEQFLPKQLTEDEVKAKLQEIITRVVASGPSDMGKVMGVATKELAGQADGRVVSTLVKGLLA